MFLSEIADAAREQVAQRKRELSFEALRRKAESLPRGEFAFEAALKGEGMSFVCEVKRASPSKGVIAAEFPYLSIAAEYARAGAAALSVLTEPAYFMGSDEYLAQIARHVPLPALRKDFTVDAYQIYEAKVLGASAALLIAALLSDSALGEYMALCDSLGLCALMEAHDERELERVLKAGARVVGVNNRDLRTFEVDIKTSLRLRPLVPAGVVYVAESGVSTPEAVEKLRVAGVDAVLIGEALMRAGDKAALLRALKGGAV